MNTLYATMSDGDVTAVAGKAIWVTLQLGGPVLLVGLIIGLVVSIFQAVTQIQEMTLAVIPKMAAVLVALLITFPWLLDLITGYTLRVFETIPAMAR